jgi:hypothetical protein
VELIKPENHVSLIKDLENRTGLKINRVEIGRIDYLRDSVRVFIFFFEKDGWATSGGDMLQLGDGDDDD